MDIPEGKSLILFDGVCNLCDKWVHRIIKYDKDKRFVFASLQSRLGVDLCMENGLENENSIVLFQDGAAFSRSEAAFRILGELKGPWHALTIFQYFPSKITDLVYKIIAKNRYRVFGKKDACIVPSQNFSDRFLDL
ncbi:MAG: DUF393 domain-containing protein [Flavobacteriales bacterium]|nr:DUF393 domain-containing protein [Flavobacteriales bacterium]